jgi:hypothetical protein
MLLLFRSPAPFSVPHIPLEELLQAALRAPAEALRVMLQEVSDAPMEALLIPAAVLLILAVVSLAAGKHEGLLALIGPAAFLALLAGILWLLRVAVSDPLLAAAVAAAAVAGVGLLSLLLAWIGGEEVAAGFIYALALLLAPFFFVGMLMVVGTVLLTAGMLVAVALFWAAYLFYTADLAAKVAAVAAAVAGLIAARRYLKSRRRGEKSGEEPP